MSTVARLRLETSSTREQNSYCDEEVNRRRSGTFIGLARAFVILPFTRVFLSTIWASQDSIVARDFRCLLDDSAYTPSSISDRALNNLALWGLVGCVLTFPSY